MSFSSRKFGVLSVLSNFLVDLPSPSSLSYLWNFGSLLGVFLVVQVFTGVFLGIHYSCSVDGSFFSVVHLMRDVGWGWLSRVVHSNGASMFFMFLYVHVGRGIYYGSFSLIMVWFSGVVILLVSMGTAFLGYVLPWGQMSFWAATVITSLLSAVPYVGLMMVEWIWGGFAVCEATLVRFFSFHFLFPFIILGLVILHLFFLHEEGSGDSMGYGSGFDKVVFLPYFVFSDLFGFVFAFMVLMVVSLEFSYVFMDVENFILANSLVTPVHIQPEWYFLFAYSILRSISNKIGGVLALLFSVFMLFFFPFLFCMSFRGFSFYFLGKFMFWVFVGVWVVLTWLGSCEVDEPFSWVGQIFSFLYFLVVVIVSGCMWVEDYIN